MSFRSTERQTPNTGTTQPVLANLSAELAAARGHLMHRPAGPSTGTTPPAVANLGDELAAARGHLQH
ncbi:hypothetical protein [Aeromonas hydrophila]|uniref:hypothetical protein n=1 Tax=Aeromonas hydrophila TaxID=644 RepID=UPI0039F5912D